MAGNRIELPADALRRCASCGTRRRNRTVGWHAIERSGELVGWTCPDCPRFDEPIRRTPAGKFKAVVGIRDEDGRRRQVRRTLDDLAAARTFVATVRTSPDTVSADLTVAELADRWLNKRLADRDHGRIRTETVDGYRSALSAPLAWIGRRHIDELTEASFQVLAHRLATVGNPAGWNRPLGHRSIRYSLLTLEQMFGWAVRQGWLPANPVAGVTPPTRPNPRPLDRWTPAQLARFREAADADPRPWVRAGMRLTLSGLRRSEVLALDWSDVDLEAGTVTVRRSRVKSGIGDVKTSRSRRTVAVEVIHPGTVGILQTFWSAQGRPERGLVVVDGLTPIRPDDYTAAFRSLCRQAGVPKLSSIHNVRHTVATALKQAGVADHHAAALFGHDVATYLRFYLITDDEGARVAAEAAGRLFTVIDSPLR